MEDAPDIGKAIKQGLKNKGWKQKDLASYMNKTSAAISEWTTNKATPSGGDLIKIAELLDIVDLLFPGRVAKVRDEVDNIDSVGNEEDALEISNAIKTGRERRGWTQKALADKLNIRAGLISKWERGEKVPRGDTLLRIIKCLEIEELLFAKVAHQHVEITNVAKSLQKLSEGVQSIQESIEEITTSIKKLENQIKPKTKLKV